MFVWGGGFFTNLLNKDVKEIKKIYLSLISVGIICLGIFLGVNITKSSYALFSDKIKGEKTIEVEVDNNIPNKPVLDTNMIAVYYDETSETWKKADSTNMNEEYKWYEYDNKMWANSVTVSSANRETYLNASPGTEISMNDILTMQVWIPRYKYKVWNYNSDGMIGSEPQEIEIVFENGTESTGEIECVDNIQGEDGDGTSEVCKLKSTGTECTDSICNNKYYTHPAFTFGEEELEGFWVGKFEVASNISCTVTNVADVGDGCNIKSIRPFVKPNLVSWRGAMIGTFETNIMAMNDNENQYGFSSSIDIHMIKNMEWGAIAYLSHSKYGICTDGECQEIGVNNNSNYITGCGSVSASTESSICNSYNTELGMGASTTGNIYGIYDMSGGAHDYVMGNMVSPDGKTMMSGQAASGANSGYTGIIYDEGNYTKYTGDYTYPNSKYYDKYSYGTDHQTLSRSKLGDAIKEILNVSGLGWGDNTLKVVYPYDSWFSRGITRDTVSLNGIFHSGSLAGNGFSNRSTHLVFVF